MKKPGESVVFKSIIGIIAPLILLSLAFGQSTDQFAFTEDFSFSSISL